jgi:NADH dehydrogenase
MRSRTPSSLVGRGDGTPQVVIVGGGFGGLYAARGLARAPVRVTIVDKRNYHLFRPMLYQVATGLLSADEVAAPIRSILRKEKNVEVLMSEVVGVDLENQQVELRDGRLHYDYLILATGIHYNYFGHEDWKRLAPGLDSVDDADRIRGKILTAFETAERIASEDGPHVQPVRELLTFVLVGGGTAGVEMAGTIAEMARLALSGDFRHIDPGSAHILLFEAAPRILPAYPERLSERARQHLESIGVDVRTNSKVEVVDAEGVVVGGSRIGSRTVLWSAGVTASPAGIWLGAETDKSGRVKVNPDLSVPGRPNVFAVGDTALVVAPTRNLLGMRGKTEALPGVAQPAIQEGRYVARVVSCKVLGKTPPRPFWYWDKGNLAIIGRTFAVADLHFVRFSGVFAWLLWLCIHIYFLIGFANRMLVILQWGVSFWTKRRGVRIFPLNRESEPLPGKQPDTVSDSRVHRAVEGRMGAR